MAAAVSTFLHPFVSSPVRSPYCSTFATARAEALNSTGRVTTWNSTARANAQMPIWIST